MKNLLWLSSLLFLACFSSQGQALKLAGANEPVILERGPHHRVVQNLVNALDSNGNRIVTTNTYVEMATGMHFRQDGKWVESKETIEVTPIGGLAKQGPHKVAFAANLNSAWSIDMLTADSKRFRSHVLGLAYTDSATGKSVLIAEVKDSIGQIVGPNQNQVIYNDAFTDFQADVRYTYTRAGFEQDVILRQRPPSPEDYGLNPDTTRLEIFTEFLDPPVPDKSERVIRLEADAQRRSTMVDPDFKDELLDFGGTQIGAGRAFGLGNQAGVNELESATAVAKDWTRIDGRDFLIEKVEYPAIKAQIDALPRAALPAKKKLDRLKNLAAKPGAIRRTFPAAPKALSQAASPMRVAAASPGATKGFVVDYATVTTTSGMTFQSDTTFLVSGSVNLSGTTTIEGGSVIKFTSTGSPQIRITGSGAKVNCLTDAYKPCVFTAKDDNTVGETISGSTGNPGTTKYATYALFIDSLSSGVASTLSGLRFNYALNAIGYNGGTGHVLKHSQIVQCQIALSPQSACGLSLRNVLICNSLYVVNVAPGATATQLSAENVTFDQANYFYNSSFGLHLTNSLLSGILNMPTYDGLNNGTGPVFQTVGAGSHYLANSSTDRNAGTTAIEPNLLNDLKTRTTYPPTLLTSFASPQILSQLAIRDTDTPDRGYHYDTLDYAWSGLTLSSSLILTNGVAVGIYGALGTTMGSGGQFVSEGSPTKMNRLTRYNTVQENASVWGTTGSTMSLLNTLTTSYATLPKVILRFTEVPFLSDSSSKRFLLNTSGSQIVGQFTLQDCKLTGAYLYIYPNTVLGMTVGITNNVLQRVNFNFDQTFYTYYGTQPYNLYLYNNLFLGGNMALYYNNNGGSATWAIKDNLFDNVTLSSSVTAPYVIPNGYNGYINMPYYVIPGSSPSGSNKTISTRDYQSGTLGTNYYPTAVSGNNLATLIGAGSRSAAAAGLYHYTVRADQQKEAAVNANVAIGFHYVATDPATSNPVNSDANPAPDYVQDRNGNGIADASEANWQSEPPVITATPPSWTYRLGSGPQLFASSATITCPDTSIFDHGFLLVRLNPLGSGQNKFSIQQEKLSANSIGLYGNSVTYGYKTIGTFTLLAAGSSDGSGLRIDFNSNATLEAVQALLRHITYEFTGSVLPSSASLLIKVNDGDVTLIPATGEYRGTGFATTGIAYIALNTPPVPDAGADFQTTTGTAIALAGSVHDDGIPTPSLKVSWQVAKQASIDSAVTFANASDVHTSVTFDKPGIYILRLTASDGELTASDDVMVSVFSASAFNSAPLVEAGPPQKVMWSGSATASLAGKVWDDIYGGGGYLSPGLTYLWSKVSGPGNVTFGGTSSTTSPLLNTTASFSALGTYLLQLTVSDGPSASGGLIGSDTTIITVCPSCVGNCGFDVVLVLDRSDSLNSGTWFADAKRAAHRLVDQLRSPNNQMALVSFAHTPTMDQELTKDFDAIDRAIENLTVLSDTYVPPALKAAHQELLSFRHNTSAKPVVVLVTDGLVDGQSMDVLHEANAIKEDGIRIISISVNSGTDPTMQAIASSDDEFKFTQQSADLEQIFSWVGNSLCLGGNTRPIVKLGGDLVAKVGVPLVLTPTISDDQLPASAGLTYSWSISPSPGNPPVLNGPTLNVTFSTPNYYEIKLTVNDSQLSSFDKIHVDVNDVPVATVATDCTAAKCVEKQTLVTQLGSLADNFPFNTPGSRWVQLGGPGSVTVANPTDPSSSMQFDTSGHYVLELEVDDSLANTKRTLDVYARGVDAGPDQAVRKQTVAATTASLTGAAICGCDTYNFSWTQISPPANVVPLGFSPGSAGSEHSINTTVNFPTGASAGDYVLRLTGTKVPSGPTYTDDVVIHLNTGTVNAGADQTIAFGQSATLAASATSATGTSLSGTWSKTSGPGIVAFGDVNASTTTASFGTPGSYVLRFTASSSAGIDELNVFVNQAPAVQAQFLADPANNPLPPRFRSDRGVFLTGDITDDYLPTGATLDFLWEKVDGPSSVTFSDPKSLLSSALFGAPGLYTLSLTVKDGKLSNGSFSSSSLTSVSRLAVNVISPPQANYDSFTVLEDSVENMLNVLRNDTDPEGDELTITKVDWPDSTTHHGKITIVGGKQLSYTPDPDFSTWETILYEITDGHGGFSQAAVDIRVKAVNDAPVAKDDSFGILAGTSRALPVTANDFDADSDRLKIVSFTQPSSGTLALKYSLDYQGFEVGTLWYTPGALGNFFFTYVVSDPSGATSTATVTLSVQTSLPVIVEGGPDQTITDLDTAFLHGVADIAGASPSTVSWQVLPAGASYQLGDPTKLDTSVRFSQPGNYSITLTADGFPDPTPMTIHVLLAGDRPPVASILNLLNDPDRLAPDPIVSEGFFTLKAIADDPNPGDTVSYKLDVYKPSTGPAAPTLIATVTPNPGIGTGGFHVGRLLADSTDHVLDPPLDFSRIPNGIYLLQLTVKSVGNNGLVQYATAQAKFALSSQLKRGQFSFSEQDLAIPVNGVPLTMIRTYNSLSPKNGDFGYSWTYAIKDLDIELDEERRDVQDVNGVTFSMRTGGGRNVTLTLPDGRRVTFVMGFRMAPFYAYAEWYAPAGVHATLAPPENRLITVLTGLSGGDLPFQWKAGSSQTPMEAFDFPRFTLKDADGTQYIIERDQMGLTHTMYNGDQIDAYGPPRLTKVQYPNNSRLEIKSDGLDYFTSGNTKIRSLGIKRDTNGRIIGILDPLCYDAQGNETGPWAVKYEYYTAADFSGDATDLRIGNLKNVQRLKNRTAPGTYDVTTYLYSEPLLPHFITKIQDPRSSATIAVLAIKQNTYDPNTGMLVSTETDAGTTTYDYGTFPDGNGVSKMTVTDPLSNKTVHEYDTRGNITDSKVISGSDQSVLSHVHRDYDEYSNVLKEKQYSTDAFGDETVYECDPQGNRTSILSPGNRETQFSYNPNGQVTSVIDVEGNATQNAYDALARLSSTRDALNNQTTYIYDDNNNGFLITVTDPLGNVTTYTYYVSGESGGRIGDLKSEATKSSSNVPLSQTDYTYDANGNRITETRWRDLSTTPPADGATTTFIYDGQNRVLETRDPLYDAATSQLHSTKTVYNSAGKPDTVTDGYGFQTQYFYDSRGNLVQTLYPATSISGVQTRTLTRTIYDANNRPIYVQDRHPQPASGDVSTASGTRMEYDAAGRLAKSERLASLTITVAVGTVPQVWTATLVANSVVSFDPPIITKNSYDQAGRIQWTINPWSNDYDYANRTAYTYDAASGRRTVSKYLNGTANLPLSTIYDYDGNGNLVTVTDPLSHKTQYDYDPLNRRIATHFPPVTGPGQSGIMTLPTVEKYDNLGRRVELTDRAGILTRFVYDGLGRLTSVVQDALGSNPLTTGYKYDGVGNLLEQTDALLRTTKYEHDKTGRRTKRTLPGLKVELFVYDKDSNNNPGNWTKHTDFQQQPKVTWLAYDALGRLIQKTPDPSFAAVPVVYQYNALGQRMSMSDASGTTTYAYDTRNQLLSKTWAQGSLSYVLKYGHDQLGRITGVTNTLAGATSVTYNWDSLGQLWSVVDHPLGGSSGTTTYGYDNAGNLLNYSYPNGVATALTYDEMNRLQTMAVTKSGSPTLANYAHTLGPAGNRTKIVESGGGISNAGTVDYTYDRLYRLQKETLTRASLNGSIIYVHDNVGNRLSRSSALNPTSLPNQSNLAYDANDRSGVATYDENGNTTAEYVPDANVQSNLTAPDVYDFENHLLRRVNASQSVQNVYDGDGNLVRQNVNGIITYYVTDDQNLTGYAQVCDELTASGSSWVVQRSYTYGRQLISQRSAGVMRYYGYDGHGNVRFLADSGGAVQDTYTYDAYGIKLGGSGTTVNPYRYSGERYDAQLGLYYNRARHLNPNTGRFWTMDTFEGSRSDPLSLHKYLYCAADPVNKTDPSGNDWNLASTTAAIGTMTILANITITSLANKSIGQHFLEKGAIPSGFFVSVGYGGAARGGTAGASSMFYYDIKSKGWSALLSGEVGLSPISLFKAQRGSAFAASVGLSFNSNDPNDFSGWGFTATWPAAMAKTVLPKAYNKWFYWLTTMAARNSIGTQLSKRSGVIQFGYSTSGASYVSYGLYYNSFSATVGYSSQAIPVSDIPDEIQSMINGLTAPTPP